MNEYFPEWQIKRINYLKHFLNDKNLKNKLILELGAMYGDIGYEFFKMGADVNCIEGREENLNIGILKHPELEWELEDLNNYVIKKHYDIIINFGLIYHLEDPERLIRDCLKNCNVLFLEGECIDSLDPYAKNIYTNEDKGLFDQSMTGVGVRLSPFYIERIFIESGFTFEILKSDECNSNFHKYNWIHKNNGEFSLKGETRRMWIARKNVSNIT